MKYSKLFVKTNKSAKEFDSKNATLLAKAGFIDQVMAGVYTFLPLGLRVLNKIETIVREEMNKIGTEVFMPSLSPKSLWEQTGRLNTVDVLMKTSGANEISRNKNTSEYILNCTHEDVVTPMVQQFATSYKDLPVAVYQIQSKFRNEARAKSGLLRTREFRMKDLYSFHKSEENLKEYYKVVQEAYWRVYERLGLRNDTYLTLASGGDFTKDYSHEFQTKCEAGEDLLFLVKSSGVTFNREVAPSKAVDPAQDTELKQKEDVFGEHIVGVDDLVKFLNLPANKTVKTLIYETDKKEVIVAAVRGDYDINEIKLQKVADCDKLVLASEATVKNITGAEIGYAGIINLPVNIKIYIDDSIENLVNFECGANKSDYHCINVNWGRDLQKPERFYDIKLAKEGDLFPETEEAYETFKACEVGNIFPLGTKYSKAFNYNYTDEDGSQKLVFMGSYGLGTSRVMGVLVEKFNDDKGIIWPEAVAPYKVHLIGLNMEDESIKQKANAIYEVLEKTGVEVFFDDREEVSAGEKFADADLIGIPMRVVVSKKTGEKVEVKKRNEKEAKLVEMEKFVDSFSLT